MHIPMHARIGKEVAKSIADGAKRHESRGGALIYRQQCASCHGLYGRPSAFASNMYPSAPQLWQPHREGVVGVSDDPPGETYWKVANGIRLTGMPSYTKILNETQMWQVSVLLANAAKPLPPQVMESLRGPWNPDMPPPAAAPFCRRIPRLRIAIGRPCCRALSRRAGIDDDDLATGGFQSAALNARQPAPLPLESIYAADSPTGT